MKVKLHTSGLILKLIGGACLEPFTREAHVQDTLRFFVVSSGILTSGIEERLKQRSRGGMKRQPEIVARINHTIDQ